MKRKWFYPLQHKANELLEGLYKGAIIRCNYQMIDRDRVMEHYQISMIEETRDVMVVMVNNGKRGEGTLLVYEMKCVASN